MGQSINILDEIKQGKISPVYLFHGDETYLIESTISDMIESLVPQSARQFNLDIFSSPDVSVDEIISIADTYPVMAERRVIVAKNPAFLSSKKVVNLFEVFLESREHFRSGNLTKSASLLAKALKLDFDEFAEGGMDFAKAIEDFKSEHEQELSSEDIEFLDDNTRNLTSQIDVFSVPPGSSGLDWLLEWLQSKASTISVIIITSNSTLNSNDKLVKAVTQIGRVLSFVRSRPSSNVLRDPTYKVANDRLKEHNKTISAEAFGELRNKTGNDMRKMFDELDKLLTFIGEKKQIDKKDVEDIVTKTDSERIFDLTRAVGQRSLALALANLRSIMKKGDHPILIHTMLTRQMRFLLQAKLLLEKGFIKQDMTVLNYNDFQKRFSDKLSSEIIAMLPDSGQLNVLKQPYPLYIAIQQIKNFTVAELINAMERLLEADIQLKSGTLTPELVVEMLVVDLCSKSS
jgi:DNA polymerase III delta subunit